MTEDTLSRFKLISHAAERLIGPLLVFIISYAHHLYFADDFISSFFAAFSLASLLFVMAMERSGVLLGIGLQLGFLGWIAICEPKNLTEQMLFSSSISLSLIATFLNNEPPAPVENKSLAEQKDKLWQELFDARQEIKTLYTQKEELEASLSQKITESLSEKEEKILFLQHHLEATLAEKQQFVENLASCEEDIKKFASHMTEMALYQETLRQEILRLEAISKTVSKKEPEPVALPPEKSSQYERLYQQLKLQFDEKSRLLDEARKNLFHIQEELSIYKKIESEKLEPTEEEKHLMHELMLAQDKLEAMQKAHDEELVGYEEVIQGLLNQLHNKA
jgi:hypothetical protein